MNVSDNLTQQAADRSNIHSAVYVTIDGILRYCIIAPLLELPIDFKEWYQPAGNPNKDAINIA